MSSSTFPPILHLDIVDNKFIHAISLPHSNAIWISIHQDLLVKLIDHASVSIQLDTGESVVNSQSIGSFRWHQLDVRHSSAIIAYSFARLPTESPIIAIVKVIDNNNKIVFAKKTYLAPAFLYIEGRRGSGRLYGWLLSNRHHKLINILPEANIHSVESLATSGLSKRNDVELQLKADTNLRDFIAYSYEESSTSFKRRMSIEKDASIIHKPLKQELYLYPVNCDEVPISTRLPSRHLTLSAATDASHPEESLPPTRQVSIIIPIYKGIQETIECLESIHRSIGSRHLTTIILGIDYSEEQGELIDRIKQLPYCSSFQIVVHETNQGFVDNVNKCFEVASKHSDILLINSDVYCPNSDWIDRLKSIAYSNASIATVTPFGSSATLYSFPTNNFNNSTVFGLDCTTIDWLLRDDSPHISWEPVPTCHGFCVYIKRLAIVDAEKLFLPIWGKGYGEENCLSMRLFKQGWIHACATNIFLYHHESVSFTAAIRDNLKEANQKKLNSIYPDYEQLVQDFNFLSPLSYSRQKGIIRILRHLFYPSDHIRQGLFNYKHFSTDPISHEASRSKEVSVGNFERPYSEQPSYNVSLWISHARGGGTHKAMCNQIQDSFINKQELPLLIQSLNEKNIDLKMHDPSRKVCHIARIDNIDYDFLEKLQAATMPSGIFLHSLVDACLDMIKWLENTPIPVYSAVHDYHWICPSIHLVDNFGDYCGAKTHLACEICFTESSDIAMSTIEQVAALGGSVSSYREKLLRILAKSEEVKCPSLSTTSIITRALKKYKLLPKRLSTQPHEDRPIWASSRCFGDDAIKEIYSKHTFNNPAIRNLSTIKIVCIGAISRIKGFDALQSFCQYINNRNLNVKIDIVGFTCDDQSIMKAGGDHVVIFGKYHDDTLGFLLGATRYDAALFLSVCPETYSFTFTAAVNAGICPVFIPRGALLERARELGVGIALPEIPSPEDIYQACIQASIFSV